MATWDNNTQHTLTMHGMTWEFGTATIASNSATVATHLKKVYAVFMTNSATSGTSDSTWCGRTVTNNQYITLESDFDGEVSYLAIGRS